MAAISRDNSAHPVTHLAHTFTSGENQVWKYYLSFLNIVQALATLVDASIEVTKNQVAPDTDTTRNDNRMGLVIIVMKLFTVARHYSLAPTYNI